MTSVVVHVILATLGILLGLADNNTGRSIGRWFTRRTTDSPVRQQMRSCRPVHYCAHHHETGMHALPDGSYPIASRDEIMRAVQLCARRYGSAASLAPECERLAYRPFVFPSGDEMNVQRWRRDYQTVRGFLRDSCDRPGISDEVRREVLNLLDSCRKEPDH